MDLEYLLQKRNPTEEQLTSEIKSSIAATKMGTAPQSSSEIYTSDSEKGFGVNHSTPPELDAGAKFVLVSRGN